MSTAESSEDNRTLLDYCQRFSELKIDKNQKLGDAPHQPILLLSVIDLIAQGLINQNKIEVSEQLKQKFKSYWNILKTYNHIKPLAKFYDNSIDQGISFCKNHHWAFDWEWFTINNNDQMIVAEDLEEISPNTKPIQEFNSESINLPKSEEHFPRIRCTLLASSKSIEIIENKKG